MFYRQILPREQMRQLQEDKLKTANVKDGSQSKPTVGPRRQTLAHRCFGFSIF